jgi:hypothetical protein
VVLYHGCAVKEGEVGESGPRCRSWTQMCALCCTIGGKRAKEELRRDETLVLEERSGLCACDVLGY